MSGLAEIEKAYRAKYPCPNCGTGYISCAEGWVRNLMCCKECSHPGIRERHAWTADELEHMWRGRDMPSNVAAEIAHLRTTPV